MDIYEYGPGLVSVKNKIIPAVNIQVDGFPRCEGPDQHLYPIYFECSFETGIHWAVTHFEESSIICHPQCKEYIWSPGDIVTEVWSIETGASLRTGALDGRLGYVIFKSWEWFVAGYERQATPNERI